VPKSHIYPVWFTVRSSLPWNSEA